MFSEQSSSSYFLLCFLTEYLKPLNVPSKRLIHIRISDLDVHALEGHVDQFLQLFVDHRETNMGQCQLEDSIDDRFDVDSFKAIYPCCFPVGWDGWRARGGKTTVGRCRAEQTIALIKWEELYNLTWSMGFDVYRRNSVLTVLCLRWYPERLVSRKAKGEQIGYLMSERQLTTNFLGINGSFPAIYVQHYLFVFDCRHVPGVWDLGLSRECIDLGFMGIEALRTTTASAWQGCQGVL